MQNEEVKPGDEWENPRLTAMQARQKNVINTQTYLFNVNVFSTKILTKRLFSSLLLETQPSFAHGHSSQTKV